MARIQYSALIDNIRGSIGGTTFQSNAYGYTVKKKPNMVNPNTLLQNERKAILGYVTRKWRDIPAGGRSSYNTFASSYPQYAKHNPSAELSGYAVFVKWNFLRVLAGLSIDELVTGAPPATDTLTYAVDVTASVLKIFITSVNDDQEWYILFFMSRVLNASQQFIGTKPRFMTEYLNIDGSIAITSTYESIFGEIPEVGDLVALDALVIAKDVPYVLARDSQIYTVVTGS